MLIPATNAQWTQQTSNTTEWLKDVYFIDDQKGFAVGDNPFGNSGTYLTTIDGGTNWVSEDLGVEASFEEIFFVNTNVGYIVGENDIFLKTINGGASWSVDTVNSMFNWLKTCYFINPDTGWVAGTYGEVYYTQDGGNSWQDRSVTASSGTEVSHIYFFDKDNGILTGSALGTYKTSNGGITWDTLSVDHYFSSFHFINDSVGYATSLWSKDIAKTIDQGTTWQVYTAPPTTSDYRDVFFTNDSVGYLVGYGPILKTSTGGTYSEEQVADVSLLELESVHFSSDSVGYAVGKSGVIVKTTNAGGATIPAADFSASQTLVCVGDTVWFSNNSIGNNTYEWLVDGSSFSTSYNSFYIFNNPNASYNISLVAYNGTYYDTSSVVINTDSSLVFNILSSQTFPVYCQGENVQFRIDSSKTYIAYQLKVGAINIGSSQNGNGGVLFLNVGTLDTTTVFSICGTTSNNCGTSTICVEDTIIIIPEANPQTPVLVSGSLICMKDSTQIEVQNSQLGYTYELLKNGLNTGIVDSGNGNSIYLSTSSLIQDANFQIEATNSVGCKNLLNTNIQISIDSVIANFNISPVNLFVGDTAFITNNSLASSYLWAFDATANYISDTIAQPFVTYNSNGEKQIKLLVSSNAGCYDSSFAIVQIFDYPSQSNGATCFFDTISQTTYSYNNGHVLDFHVDHKGNTYVGGRFADNWGQRKDCMFLKKFDKNGLLKWEEAQSAFTNNYSTYRSSYVSGIATDENLNVYITGSYSAVKFTMDTITINHSLSTGQAQSYIAKLDSNGQTQWIIHTDITGAPRGGTDIVCKNENQIFVSILGTTKLFFPDGTVQFFSDNNFILEIDKDGRFKNYYPINNVYDNGSYSMGYLNTTNYQTITSQLQPVSPKLEISKDGRIYVFGKYINSINIGGFSLSSVLNNYPLKDNANAYVAILDTLLGWQDAFTLYGRSEIYTYGTGVTDRGIYPTYALDRFNNIYVTESMGLDYWGDPIKIIYNNGDSVVGENHSMISKFDNYGNLIWSNKNLGINISGIESYNDDEIILYGGYADFMGLNLNRNMQIGNSSNGSMDLAIISIDSSGTVNWIDNLGSQNSDVALFSEKNECGELYFLGNLQDTTITNYGTLNNNGQNLFALHFAPNANCIYECEPGIPCNILGNYSYIDNGNGNYSFTNTSSGNFNQFHWAFGDGTISTQMNPNHTFSANGTYAVVLTVNDSLFTNSSCFDYFVDTIVVAGAPSPVQCVAGFVMYPDTGINNVTVINSSVGSNLTYLWDFGDGDTSTQAYPSHVYATNGPFYLCLTIDDGNGCVDTYCDSIGVNGVVFDKQSGFTINVFGLPIATQIEGDIILNKELTIYPNPTGSTLYIVLSETKPIQLYIYSIDGKLVESTTIKGNTPLDVSQYESGMYFIKATNQEGKIFQSKFVKE